MTSTAEGREAASGSGRIPASIRKEENQAVDQSIQNYGAEAAGDERASVIAAMRSFFGALAASDYAQICTGLSSSNREQLQQYRRLAEAGSGDCAAVLEKLFGSAAGAAEARKAARATVSRVRVGDGSAFVLFRPAGGKLNYFVMQDEDGAWKATSISAGTPLVP